MFTSRSIKRAEQKALSDEGGGSKHRIRLLWIGTDFQLSLDSRCALRAKMSWT